MFVVECKQVSLKEKSRSCLKSRFQIVKISLIFSHDSKNLLDNTKLGLLTSSHIGLSKIVILYIIIKTTGTFFHRHLIIRSSYANSGYTVACSAAESFRK